MRRRHGGSGSSRLQVLGASIKVGGVPIVTARRATFLIDKEGKVVEAQVDSEAVDPTKIVDACEVRAKSAK